VSQAKHIAASGLHAGEWVNCPAQHQCTLRASKNHTTLDELQKAREYAEEQGRPVTGTQHVSLTDVLHYRVLSDAKKQKLSEKVEARKNAIQIKKANKKVQPGTQLRTNRIEAKAIFDSTKDEKTFFKKYFTQYPNLVNADIRTQRRVFNSVESSFYADADIGRNVHPSENFTKINKAYELQDSIVTTVSKVSSTSATRKKRTIEIGFDDKKESPAKSKRLKPIAQIKEESARKELKNLSTTMTLHGKKYTIAPEGKSGTFCKECGYHLTEEESSDATLSFNRGNESACPNCDHRVPTYNGTADSGMAGYGLSLLPESVKYADENYVRQTKWYHATIRENWHEGVLANEEEKWKVSRIRKGQDDAMLVHLGTLDAAKRRMADINEQNSFRKGKQEWFIHEVTLDADCEVSTTITPDEDSKAPEYAYQCVERNDDVYSAKGATRYVNMYENPGSISLLANPKAFKVTKTINVEV
jgi:predicted Zn-ribbon and HTH transcriptional regulator